jgi:type II secretory pathway pseudopilin PulG
MNPRSAVNLVSPIARPQLRASRQARCAAAFTLTELVVTMAIVLLVLAGATASHLFGARLYQITKVKLGANDDARRALSTLIEEVRSAKIVKVGTGDAASFAEMPLDTPQQGTALQIHATTNTNVFIRYFWDPADQSLKRTTSSDAGAVTVVAHYISNSLVFSAEDPLGNVLSNNQNNRVIGVLLQFYQIEYPVVSIGPGQHYDYYQLRTRITRRALE